MNSSTSVHVWAGKKKLCTGESGNALHSQNNVFCWIKLLVVLKTFFSKGEHKESKRNFFFLFFSSKYLVFLPKSCLSMPESILLQATEHQESDVVVG